MVRNDTMRIWQLKGRCEEIAGVAVSVRVVRRTAFALGLGYAHIRPMPVSGALAPLRPLAGGEGGAHAERRGRVRWVVSLLGACGSPTSPRPSPPPGAERGARMCACSSAFDGSQRDVTSLAIRLAVCVCGYPPFTVGITKSPHDAKRLERRNRANPQNGSSTEPSLIRTIVDYQVPATPAVVSTHIGRSLR